MDVATSDDGTDNEARNMRKAEKEAKKLEKEYKASVLDALHKCNSEYIFTLKSDTAASIKNRKF